MLHAFTKHPNLCLSKRFKLGHLFLPEILVKTSHERACCLVGDLPQAGHDGPCACNLKGALQVKQTFSACRFAEASLTGREPQHDDGGYAS